MAKQKEDNRSKELKEIEKKYGNVISKGNEVLAKKQNLKSLSFSPSMDIGLNGGLLEGSWTVLSGPPKQGKSSSALQLCSNAQKDGRKVIYLDGENRLKGYNLMGIQGLNLEEMDIIHSTDDRQLSAEDFLTITELLYKQEEYKGCIIIIDSTSSLLPRSELDADVSGTIRANFPKLMAHWIKKNSQSIVNQRVIIVLITHYITNTSGYGKQKVADGGLYIQYQADTILDLTKSEPWLEGDIQVGLECHWRVATSSMGASNKEVTTFLRFGKGIDSVQEIIKIAETYGLVDKSGAWYTCIFMEDQPDYDKKNYTFQGMAKLYAYLSSSPEVYSILEKKVKALL